MKFSKEIGEVEIVERQQMFSCQDNDGTVITARWSILHSHSDGETKQTPKPDTSDWQLEKASKR